MPKITHHQVQFEVYAVGLLRDLLAVRRNPCKRTWRALYRHMKDPYKQFLKGDYHAAKNHFNGYLAEPENLSYFVTCGTGWTWRRAVRSFFAKNPVYRA